MEAEGDRLEGNTGDLRIDGWAEGKWFHRENQTMDHHKYDLFIQTLTVSVKADLEMLAICYLLSVRITKW